MVSEASQQGSLLLSPPPTNGQGSLFKATIFNVRPSNFMQSIQRYVVGFVIKRRFDRSARGEIQTYNLLNVSRPP